MTVKLLVWRDDSSVNTSLYIQSEPNEGTETMIPDLLADSHLQQVPRLAREVKKSDKVRM